MNWKRIPKSKDTQPKYGSYSDWKEQIAKECFFQCIYCSINEAQFGGIDHYHIEHFRPKSIPRFKKLVDDITNLYYCCPICNRFKSNDWPNDPDSLDIICYPDPSSHNYLNLFRLDLKTCLLEGKYISSKYMLERLYLNRPQLLFERREDLLIKREKILITEIEVYKDKLNPDLLRKMLDVITDLHMTMSKRRTIRPYKLADIRK